MGYCCMNGVVLVASARPFVTGLGWTRFGFAAAGCCCCSWLLFALSFGASSLDESLPLSISSLVSLSLPLTYVF